MKRTMQDESKTLKSILPAKERVFIALDNANAAAAAALALRLKGSVGGVKLGHEFFTANGPHGVAQVAAAGLPIFLDFKFHDIPNTVAAAVRAALLLKPFMLNVHAAGGRAMMKAAMAAIIDAGDEGVLKRPLMLAVTVLTSLDDDDLKQTGIAGAAIDQVRRLALLAKDCGLDGVVCSAREAAILRQDLGLDFKLVTPGIRPAWAEGFDQKRFMTPLKALAAGADYLIVGRPVTAAADPMAAVARIVDELTHGH